MTAEAFHVRPSRRAAPWRPRPTRSGSGRRLGPGAAILLGTGLATVLALGMSASPAAAAGRVTFAVPSATAVLLQPLVFRDTFTSDVPPSRVELLVTSPFVPGTTVDEVTPTARSNGSWQVTMSQPDAGSVNTVYLFSVRVTLPDGTTATSPTGTATVTDPRFAWQSVSGRTVTLHWYGYTRAQAQAWLNAAESAVTRASAAFGVTSVSHVDFFVYSASQPFFDAVNGGANADADGVYILDTHTALGTILPSDLGSSWPDQEIAHEVTHHVFAAATRNPYHEPPLWLDEGCAVYYSEGVGPRDAELEQGIADGAIIPLEGLAGAFPSTTDSFLLSYAEAVSAVDFFLRTHGSPALRTLLAAYARGSTDDEAFEAATHASAAAFDAAWLSSIGVRPPTPYGPRAAPAGPAPPGWSSSGVPGVMPSTPAAPGSPLPSGATGSAVVLIGFGAGLAAIRQRRATIRRSEARVLATGNRTIAADLAVVAAATAVPGQASAGSRDAP